MTFGVPSSLVFYNVAYFSYMKIVGYALEHNMKIKYSINYYPQLNGVVESMNKKFLQIIIKIIVEHHRD